MDQMPRAAVDPLVKGKVIPDIAVNYGGAKIECGGDVKPSLGSQKPRQMCMLILGGAGKEIMPYMGPQPPAGTHRYVFAAFRQHGPMETVRRRPVEREQFNTRQFSSENDLGLPAAALYFKSQKQ
ncbi:hypothetical protein ACJIZ3_006525 [Penstemon smallii]|uniref:Phosphatidylethanolamine-binding protein n=1 Tax=Penstemon smallii TaxID=265156 RepID=A0ABD3S7Y1_9LAMI